MILRVFRNTLIVTLLFAQAAWGQVIDLPGTASRQVPSLIDALETNNTRLALLYDKHRSTDGSAAFFVANLDNAASVGFSAHNVMYARLLNDNGDCLLRDRQGVLWRVRVQWSAAAQPSVASSVRIDTPLPVFGAIAISSSSGTIWYSTRNSASANSSKASYALGSINIDSLSGVLVGTKSGGQRLAIVSPHQISIVSAQDTSEVIDVSSSSMGQHSFDSKTPARTQALSLKTPVTSTRSKLPMFTVAIDAGTTVKVDVDKHQLWIGGKRVSHDFTSHLRPRAVKYTSTHTFVFEGKNVVIIDNKTRLTRTMAFDSIIDPADSEGDYANNYVWALYGGSVYQVPTSATTISDMKLVGPVRVSDTQVTELRLDADASPD